MSIVLNCLQSARPFTWPPKLAAAGSHLGGAKATTCWPPSPLAPRLRVSNCAHPHVLLHLHTATAAAHLRKVAANL